MSTFDPELFLQSAQTTEANSTEIVPIPVGEYMAGIDAVKCIPWAKKDGTASGLKLQVAWIIEDESVKAVLGRDKVVAFQDVMLDLTEANGLDTGTGKNVNLGRLREAVGLNTPGAPFSFLMLPGRQAKLSIGHRIDTRDNVTVHAEVKGVAKLG